MLFVEMGASFQGSYISGCDGRPGVLARSSEIILRSTLRNEVENWHLA
jgi:hypothetical protein